MGFAPRLALRYNHRLMFKSLIDWYLGALSQGGYALVALLMAIESSIVPLPSEFVIPPAAHLAWTDGLNFFNFHLTGWSAEVGIVLAGAVGSWLGATVMYWASRWAGRPLVMRYGKYVFIPPEKVEGAERWAQHYGAMGIFIRRAMEGRRPRRGARDSRPLDGRRRVIERRHARAIATCSA
jgi:membrane protein DedA with SNARE-associated domain